MTVALSPLLIGDIGFGELIVIALVAIVVFGPDKLPELAKQAGAMVRKARDFANAARDDLRDELGPDYADLELRDLDPRAIVRKHIVEAMEGADEEAERSRKRGEMPLLQGELPPFDADAT
ncbi:sec-independent translocase [Nocardioides sp. C4-1]|uniref:sec-independent translocase n=1 Tax=Nocardioides sp. C4-1 TaxID=3151851 RepID=UPI00326773FB